MDVLAWVRSEVEPLAASLQPSLPDASTPLCEFLRDGRALVLLTAALTSEPASDNQQPQDVTALPKNLQRSLHQTTTFHALERIQFFIKWCRADAALDAFVVFSSVQLLDEQNDKVVGACLEALRSKYRPQLKGSAAVASVPDPIAISTTPIATTAAATAAAVVASPATPSKSSGLWVKRSSAHQLLASPASSRNNSDSSNQSAHETASPAAQPLPVSSLSNRLNAFLNKFPSETNVLTAAPVLAAIASPVAVDEAQPQDDDEDEDNNVEEEAVEAYNEDEEDAALPTEPRAPFADALSPRSEHERSSFGSSLSFSFTSDPRHHESLTEDTPPQPNMNLSFSSVLSSPPASPKPAPRLRIPSIFERNAEKEKAAAEAAATDRSSSTSSSTPKDETTARAVSKLSIPAAFSSSSSSTVSIDSTASATAVETAASTVAAETAAATPKPVSKLNIPAAFARSSSTSSSTSDRSSFSKTTSATSVAAVVGQEGSSAASPQPVLVKKPSRLKIPSAFASGAATVAATVTAAVVVAAPVDAPVAEANSSPLAAFVTSPSTTSHSASSASPSRPANKLAAFLSTVEVANAFMTEAGEASSDNVEPATNQQECFSDDESDSDESVDADEADEPAVEMTGLRFSLSQETAIGLPDDSTPVSNRVHHSMSLSAEPPATNEVAPEDVEEEHSIEHHDHTDSEQPFFVVEEVSMTKPPTSSKLYAFLSAVDSTESPRFSHTSSSGGAGGDDKSHHLDEAAASAAARLSGGGSQRNSVEGHTTASEHSERSPSNSVTSQPLAAASSDVILEKERLSGENLALQLKLRTVESKLSAKDVEAAALRAEVMALQAHLAAAATPSDFRLKSAAEAFKAQVAEAKAAHVKTIKAAQAAREQFLSEKKLLEAQLRSISTKTPSQSGSAVAALTAQLAEAKASHLKTIKTAQATREHFASQTKLLEGQLRVMKQQSHSAAEAFSSRLAEAKKAHVKTIKAAQFSREHFASENVKFMTLALQKQSSAAALSAQVVELKKAHLKTIKTAQFSREQLALASGGIPPVAQTTTTITAFAAPQDDSTLSTLAEQNRAFEQKLQAAKDSEEAARNSVQLALMELIRSQQATIAQLSQRAA
ncbi:hypothetical protein Gpo141_00006823 [Globisporangium polare]